MKLSKRQLRVGSLVQQELAEVLLREMDWAHSGTLLSVTNVRVSPDLAIARCSVSLFGGKTDELFVQLESATPEIRMRLGRRMGKNMRIIPQLTWQRDDSLDASDRIDTLLQSVRTTPEP
ncbi:MAG: 30S ribosome-binding factor RbfA [Sphingomonadales bacterium]|nr:30S ribosome-binding factor RbfA [Sphingomonadales bacterium]